LHTWPSDPNVNRLVAPGRSLEAATAEPFGKVLGPSGNQGDQLPGLLASGKYLLHTWPSEPTTNRAVAPGRSLGAVTAAPCGKVLGPSGNQGAQLPALHDARPYLLHTWPSEPNVNRLVAPGRSLEAVTSEPWGKVLGPSGNQADQLPGLLA